MKTNNQTTFQNKQQQKRYQQTNEKKKNPINALSEGCEHEKTLTKKVADMSTNTRTAPVIL